MNRLLRRYKRYPKYRDSGVKWVASIPEHWTIERLKTIANVRLSNVDKKSEEGQESVRLCNYVDVYYNDRITSELPFMAATATKAQIERFQLRRGDVLITKDSESWDDIAIPSVVADDLEDVLCGYHLALIRPEATLHGPYLARAFAAPGVRDQFRVSANGITRFGLGSDAIGTAVFMVPPVDEQRAIATFLDRETAKVDALVAKKERLIELLHEKRSALIAGAVTKGLDPRVVFSPSGLPLPELIPAHWTVRPLTRSITEKSDYRGKTPEKVVAGVRLVTARNIRMGTIDYDTSEEYVSDADYDEIMRRGKPRIGDILFTTEAPLGNVAQVDCEDIALAQRVIRFRMAPSVNSRFALLAMMSDYFQQQIAVLSTGSTAEGLKASKLSMLRIVVPPMDEQLRIVEHVSRETHKIDTLVNSVRLAISRLHELRDGLIASAVTGEIDVRQEVA